MFIRIARRTTSQIQVLNSRVRGHNWTGGTPHMRSFCESVFEWPTEHNLFDNNPLMFGWKFAACVLPDIVVLISTPSPIPQLPAKTAAATHSKELLSNQFDWVRTRNLSAAQYNRFSPKGDSTRAALKGVRWQSGRFSLCQCWATQDPRFLFYPFRATRNQFVVCSTWRNWAQI